MERSDKTSILRVIAEKAGVSVSTVSFVLNNHGDQMRISKATQQRIRQIAQAENYTPNIYARGLRKSAGQGSGKVVGVLWSLESVNESMGWFFSNAYRECNEHGYQMELTIQFFRPGRLCEMEELKDPWRFSGLIVFGLQDADVAFLKTCRIDIPVVVSRPVSEGWLHCVYTDNTVVGGRAAEELGAHGYRRAGLVKTVNPSAGAVARSEAFVRRAAALGMICRPEWCVELEPRDFRTASGCIGALLSRPERPDALFVTNQGIALNTAVAVNQWKQRTGQDCALVFCFYDEGIEALVDNLAIIDMSNSGYAAQSTRLIWELMHRKPLAPVRIAVPPLEMTDKLKTKPTECLSPLPCS